MDGTLQECVDSGYCQKSRIDITISNKGVNIIFFSQPVYILIESHYSLILLNIESDRNFAGLF